MDTLMKNKRGTYVPDVKGCFYICAGLSLHDVSGTVTNRELFVGFLR